MLDKRGKEIGIVFVGGGTNINISDDTVSEHDSICLYCNTERILVRDLQIFPNGKYVGIVYGFEPATKNNTILEIGQKIEFFEINIFSCTKTRSDK